MANNQGYNFLEILLQKIYVCVLIICQPQNDFHIIDKSNNILCANYHKKIGILGFEKSIRIVPKTYYHLVSSLFNVDHYKLPKQHIDKSWLWSKSGLKALRYRVWGTWSETPSGRPFTMNRRYNEN